MAEKYPGDRAAYVAGLKAELATLDRRSNASFDVDGKTRTRRIKEVEAELDRYSDEPKSKWRETATSSSSSTPAGPPKVKDVLTEVGDDKAKAQAALAAELALDEDDRRSSLVTKLETIIAAE